MTNDTLYDGWRRGGWNREMCRWTWRRWVRNRWYWLKSDIASIRWHFETLFGPRRIYCIRHHYQYDWVPNVYISGRGNPGNNLAYLQFRAEYEFQFHCDLDNEGAAKLLAKFYGYKVLPFKRKDRAIDADLYWIREDRCGHPLHNHLARLLYWRKGISADLKEAVDEV